MRVEFIQLAGFTKAADCLFDDDDLRDLENTLIESPKAGASLGGTGGARKLRVPLSGRGKRGGGRVIYWHHEVHGHMYLILVYAKSDKDDLTSDEIAAIGATIKYVKELGKR